MYTRSLVVAIKDCEKRPLLSPIEYEELITFRAGALFSLKKWEFVEFIKNNNSIFGIIWKFEEDSAYVLNEEDPNYWVASKIRISQILNKQNPCRYLTHKNLEIREHAKKLISY